MSGRIITAFFLACLLASTASAASIKVDSTPSGADVYFNGEFRGNTPLTITNVNNGAYAIRIEKDAYSTKEKSVRVRRGRDKSIRIKLKRIVSDADIVVYGDTRTNHDEHRKLMKMLLNSDPGTVFHTGDLVENGVDQSHWDTFNSIIQPLKDKASIYPALGNHEQPNDPNTLYFDQFSLPGNERWYSVDTLGARFIILDVYSDYGPGSDQYRWLQDTLDDANNNRNIKFQIVVMHMPVFSSGNHWSETKPIVEKLVPLFERKGVDAVFSGHDHDYERAVRNKVTYVVAGGGGAPLRPRAITSPPSWWGTAKSIKFMEELNFCTLNIKDRKIDAGVFNEKGERIDKFRIRRIKGG
ncbi:MAG: metallophosphoesterase [Candidatus Altiarchaeota archaeon]